MRPSPSDRTSARNHLPSPIRWVTPFVYRNSRFRGNRRESTAEGCGGRTPSSLDYISYRKDRSSGDSSSGDGIRLWGKYVNEYVEKGCLKADPKPQVPDDNIVQDPRPFIRSKNRPAARFCARQQRLQLSSGTAHQATDDQGPSDPGSVVLNLDYLVPSPSIFVDHEMSGKSAGESHS